MQPEQDPLHGERDRRVIIIKNAFCRAWHSTSWVEVGMLMQSKDIVSSAYGLRESQRPSDYDFEYDDHVLNVLERIVDRDPGNELKLARYALSKLTGPFAADSPERDQLQKVVDYLEVIRVIGGDDLSEHPNIANQVNRIKGDVYDDPEAAIGSCKDLVESALKNFLDMPGDEPQKHDMPQLIKEARGKLTEDLGSLEHNNDMLKMLSNFGQIMESIATVRNKHGTGHGRGPEETFNLPQPYVVLAANSAISAAVFLTQMHDLKTVEPEGSFKAEDSPGDLDEGEDLPW